MPELLRMPEVSANLERAILSSWVVDEGATFAAKDILAIIETDKAIVEYEAEADGRLARHLVAAGTEVEVGAPIAVIALAGEPTDNLDALLDTAALGTAVVNTAKDPVGTSAVNDQPAVRDTASIGPPIVETPESNSQTDLRNAGRVFSSPLARKIARDAELDLAALVGTGPHGRIVRRDVDSVIVSNTAAVASGRSSPAGSDETATLDEVGFVDVPHSRMRRAIAARLTQSKMTVPHIYVRATVDADELLKLREQINDSAPARVSLTDLIIKAVAKAHGLVPALNVTWTADAVRTYRSVDIGVAVAAPAGLLVPVVRSVETMSITQVAAAVGALARQARDGRIRQHELEGGTITVSNLGMHKTEDFAAIINPPQASILAVGATRRVPIVRGEGIVPGTVFNLTLSVDHRPVDGVQAAEWLRALVTLLEHPVQILT